MSAAAKRTALAAATVTALVVSMLVPAGSAAPSDRDRTAPSVPQRLRVTAATPSLVTVAWDPSVDDVGVVGYYVYGDKGKATVEEPVYTVRTLGCGQSTLLGVAAFDDSQNRSERATITVSTAACADRQSPTSPSGFVQLATSQNAVILGWSPSSDNIGVVEYGVYRDLALVARAAEPNVTLGALACGSTYTYAIDAADAAGNRSPRSNVFVRTAACATPPAPGDGTPPSTPTGLAASSVAQTSLALNWNAASDNVGVVGYDVYRNGSKVASPTATSVSQSGLACGTSYAFAVSARDSAGNTSGSAQLSVATGACAQPPPPGDATPPSTPSALAISGVTGASVSLKWSASSDNVGVAGYGIYVNGVQRTTTAQLSATMSGLVCGTSYLFEVEAVDFEGNNSPRASVTGSTATCGDTQAPSAPSGVSATSRTATSIALSWNPSTDNVGVTGYGLYRGGAPTGTALTTDGIFTGLVCNTNYTLAVDAYDAAGNRSSKTTVMVSTTACPDTAPPSTPTGLAASSVTQSSLTLTWNASTDNTGVTGYDVYRNGTKMATATTTSASQTGLACGTAYAFGVIARDTAGNSSAQASLQASTAACPAPAPTSWSGPITITQGGTYSGSWESTSSSTPAVRIATSQPVTITGRVRNLAGGTLIDLPYSVQASVTVDHVFGYGGNGRFLEAEQFKSVTVRNCTIDKTSGIKLATPASGASVLIARNKHRNIQRGSASYGNFVQLAEVQSASVEISWNEIVNDYNQSEPEDLVSIFKSAHIRLHDNYFQGQYSPNNTTASSQNGITLENGNTPTAGLDSYDNEIWGNQLIATAGGIGMFPGTRDNYAHDNRVVQDGFLPDGTTRIGAGFRGMSIQSGTTNNRASGNSVGYVNKDGVRNDYGFDGAPGELAKNTSLPNPVTKATEDAELAIWQSKLAANGVTLGA